MEGKDNGTKTRTGQQTDTNEDEETKYTYETR